MIDQPKNQQIDPTELPKAITRYLHAHRVRADFLARA
jgi:hypothetical protein